MYGSALHLQSMQARAVAGPFAPSSCLCCCPCTCTVCAAPLQLVASGQRLRSGSAWRHAWRPCPPAKLKTKLCWTAGRSQVRLVQLASSAAAQANLLWVDRGGRSCALKCAASCAWALQTQLRVLQLAQPHLIACQSAPAWVQLCLLACCTAANAESVVPPAVSLGTAADWRQQAVVQWRVQRKRALRQAVERLEAALAGEAQQEEGTADAAADAGREEEEEGEEARDEL